MLYAEIYLELEPVSTAAFFATLSTTHNSVPLGQVAKTLLPDGINRPTLHLKCGQVEVGRGLMEDKPLGVTNA